MLGAISLIISIARRTSECYSYPVQGGSYGRSYNIEHVHAREKP